jgi:hypothetical protein
LTEEPEHPKLVSFSFILSCRFGCFACSPSMQDFLYLRQAEKAQFNLINFTFDTTLKKYIIL